LCSISAIHRIRQTPVFTFEFDEVPGWLKSGAGVFNPTVDQVLVVPEGQQIAYSNNGGLNQFLAAVVTADTKYTLSVDVGMRLDLPAPPADGFVGLLAGTGLSESEFVELASSSVTLVNPGAFQKVTVIYTASSSDPALGLPLIISLGGGASNQVLFDNVRLDASPTGNQEPMPSPTDISARVLNTTNIPIPHATTTYLTFNSEHWDTANIHDTTTNTHCLTPPVPGKYLVYGHVQFAPNSKGVRLVSIQRLAGNNRGLATMLVNAVSGGFETALSVATHVEAAAGDCLILAVYQTSGKTLDVQLQPDISPEFGLVKLP
jgi:hypothetical protein